MLKTDWEKEELLEMHGQKCEFETKNGHIAQGKISVSSKRDSVYVVHDNEEAEGATAEDMLGYKYSWCVDLGDEYKWIDIKDGVLHVDENKLEEILITLREVAKNQRTHSYSESDSEPINNKKRKTSWREILS